MIEIGRRQTLIDDPQAVDTHRRRPEDGDRRTGRNDASLGEGMLSGEFGRDLGGERGEAFARRLSRALGQPDAIDDATGGAMAAAGAEAMRVLAVAGLVATAPGPAAAADPAGPTPRLVAMVERIEKAIAAQGLAGLPGAVSLKLDLTDLGGSIAGVAITLTRDTIDLVLTRTAGGVDLAPFGVAQDLADRLHLRFPRRVVRILESATAAEETPRGLAAYSRLLHPSGDAS